MYACYKKYISYLSLTFLCEFRVYLSMEICKKKPQMEYLLTFLIHDPHLAKWEDYVNNKMIFKWNLSCVLVRNPGSYRCLVITFLCLSWKMSNARMKYHEANQEKTNCYTLCQWWCYLRFQVSLNLLLFYSSHSSSWWSQITPPLNNMWTFMYTLVVLGKIMLNIYTLFSSFLYLSL